MSVVSCHEISIYQHFSSVTVVSKEVFSSLPLTCSYNKNQIIWKTLTKAHLICLWHPELTNQPLYFENDANSDILFQDYIISKWDALYVQNLKDMYLSKAQGHLSYRCSTSTGDSVSAINKAFAPPRHITQENFPIDFSFKHKKKHLACTFLIPAI